LVTPLKKPRQGPRNFLGIIFNYQNSGGRPRAREASNFKVKRARKGQEGIFLKEPNQRPFKLWVGLEFPG